ncbi:uncharacterized protein [Eulemur rufifrons]|uniref:uncharacterized protein n=1 Tax=Eulemur rufifrons TaxID=859984 RepID=UPI0037439C84
MLAPQRPPHERARFGVHMRLQQTDEIGTQGAVTCQDPSAKTEIKTYIRPHTCGFLACLLPFALPPGPRPPRPQPPLRSVPSFRQVPQPDEHPAPLAQGPHAIVPRWVLFPACPYCHHVPESPGLSLARCLAASSVLGLGLPPGPVAPLLAPSPVTAHSTRATHSIKKRTAGWLRHPLVGHDPARLAEDLRLEVAEEPLREDPHPGPSPSSCCASRSFLVWAEAITWNPAWERTSAMGPQHPPALNPVNGMRKTQADPSASIQ